MNTRCDTTTVQINLTTTFENLAKIFTYLEYIETGGVADNESVLKDIYEDLGEYFTEPDSDDDDNSGSPEERDYEGEEVDVKYAEYRDSLCEASL